MPVLIEEGSATGGDSSGRLDSRTIIQIIIGVLGFFIILVAFYTLCKCFSPATCILRKLSSSSSSPSATPRRTATRAYPTSTPRRLRFWRTPAQSGHYVEMHDSPSPSSASLPVLEMQQAAPAPALARSDSAYSGKSSIAAVRGYPVVSVPAAARLSRISHAV
ncbi:hypothetical protein FKP32DRAFT_1590083 [Trametes sanguinea]|nr:hypothetical protein FKP32DRAFT_1590083 [Trametes sanguinea]